MPPLINLLRGNAVKLEHLRHVCDTLEITTTPKTKKVEMQTAIDDMVTTYPEYETQVRETISKLVADSKKQKQSVAEEEEEIKNTLSPNATEFQPQPTSQPVENPPQVASQPPLFDSTQENNTLTPVFSLNSTEHMDISTPQSSNDHKRKLTRDEEDDETELASKRNRCDLSPMSNKIWKDVRSLLSAFKETKKAFEEERTARIRAENERDLVKNEKRVFTDTMKREIHASIQEGISHVMEKLSADLSTGLSQIKKSQSSDGQTVQIQERQNGKNAHPPPRHGTKPHGSHSAPVYHKNNKVPNAHPPKNIQKRAQNNSGASARTEKTIM